MALLNSALYSYLHLKLYGGVNKIAKENLMALPFPRLSSDQRQSLDVLVGSAMLSGDDSELQEFIHVQIFGLKPSDISYVVSSI